jgi:hypothetical protein
MAKIILNPLIEGMSGKFGNVVFRSTPGGVVVSKRPARSSVKPSEAQMAQRQRFKEAVAYARQALSDPNLSSLYQQAAAEQKRRPFDVAVSDFLNGRNLLAD